jgi:hypothetical protein
VRSTREYKGRLPTEQVPLTHLHPRLR